MIMNRRACRLLGVIGAAVSGALDLLRASWCITDHSAGSHQDRPGRTESAGSAHFITDASSNGPLPGSSSTTRVLSSGDVEFTGTKVSLVTRVTATQSGDAPTSEQIAIGRNFYIRYVPPSPSVPPGRWSKGKTRQPYPYLGVVEPVALAQYRGPVKTVGTARVNGLPSTEYALSFPAEVRSLPIKGNKTQHISVRPFVVDVWLNRAGQIVRTSARQVATDNGSTVKSSTMVTLSRFGEPVHIVAPQPLVPS